MRFKNTSHIADLLAPITSNVRACNWTYEHQPPSSARSNASRVLNVLPWVLKVLHFTLRQWLFASAQALHAWNWIATISPMVTKSVQEMYKCLLVSSSAYKWWYNPIYKRLWCVYNRFIYQAWQRSAWHSMNKCPSGSECLNITWAFGWSSLVYVSSLTP